MDLKRINSLTGKKRFLLNYFNFQSIQAARREITGSDIAIYNYLKDEYNTIIEPVIELNKKNKAKNKRHKINYLKDFNVEAGYDNDKSKRKSERQMLYQSSLANKFFVLNFPKNMNACLKAISNKNETDVMFAYRNMINRRKNKVNQYSFEVNSIQDMKNKLLQLYLRQKNAFKISIQFSFVFEIVTEKNNIINYSYKVFHANSNKFYKEAALITNKEQLQRLMNTLNFDNIYNYIYSMRPSSAENIIGVTTLDVKIFDMNYRIGANIDLPKYILDSRSIISMDKSINNMCFWNCLAYHKLKDKRCFAIGKDLFQKFYNHKSNKNYLGFDIYNELEKFESQFKIGVNIFELGEYIEKENKYIYNDLRLTDIEDDKINLLLFKNHFCYIKDLSALEKTLFKCDKCGHLFCDSKDLKKHQPICGKEKTDTFVYFPQVYEPERNLILQYNEIFDCNCDFKYENFIVFDFESILLKVNKQTSKNMKITNKHQAVSVSIYSNVRGFEEPIFIENSEPKYLIKQMFEVFNLIALKVQGSMTEKYKPLYDKIDLLKESRQKCKFAQRLDDYVNHVPVIGFNSGFYDINLNIVEFINEMKNDKITSIKNGNSYKALIAGNLKFLDICQYLPPGYNLDTYVKAFNPNGMKKSIFPYEYLDSYDKLDEDINVLSQKHFYSSLKNKNISVVEWNEFLENKVNYEWRTIRDLLKFYNNLDVKPFLEAIVNHKNFFYDLGIDMFKDGFSLPALAEKIMFSYELKDFNETFINQHLKPNYKIDVYANINNKLKGYKEQDIQTNRYNENMFIVRADVCNTIFKQGGKCLYCWKRCYEDDWSLDRIDNIYGHNSDNCVLSCIACNKQRSDMLYKIFYRKKALVRYSFNNPLIYLIDEANKEVFYKLKQNITGGASIVFHRHHEVDVTRIKRPVYSEGQWRQGNDGKVVKNITGYDANALYLWCIGRDMLNGVLKYETYEGNNMDTFINDFEFGMLEVDIYTPKELYNFMGEFPLIFKNIEYEVPDDNGKMKKERKLISSFKGEKILIKSDRLKWLLSKGLKVSKIHGYIKAKRGKIFEKFVQVVSDFRRKGDVDKKFAIIAEMWKLVGNSAFGRTGMNKNKFYKTVYGDEHVYNKEVARQYFRDANEYGDVYEITKDKRKTMQNIPIQVACSIYDDSKLKMSSFYYDCVDKYLSREDYQYIEMDTDSAYMALTGEFESMIKPGMKDEFIKDRNNWFLRNDTDEHMKFDKRVAGLFKPEFVGRGIVALTSKSYYVKGFDSKDKLSSKGIQQSNNDLSYELYKKVLFEDEKHVAKNKGFRILNNKQVCNELIYVNDNEGNNTLIIRNHNTDETQTGRTIYMYELEKTGLTAKYNKRVILDDKVSTVPLDI